MVRTTNKLQTDSKYDYSIISLFILFALFLIIVINVSAQAASSSETVIDSVNIGDSIDEADHNLFGFGPIEPANHGGSWGGADDGNLRVVWYNDSANPSGSPTQSPDENYASARLSIPSNYLATKIEIRVLDGIADDSFEIYIDDSIVYSYSDEGSAETWKTHEIDVSLIDLSSSVEIKIKSTSPKWGSFDTYGQLAISWIKLYAIEGEQVTVKLMDSNNNSLEDGYVEYYSGGWKEFGITDSNGQATKLIPKARYTFRMTYLGAINSKRQDIRIDPVVVFSTIEVSVRFEDSNGLPLSNGFVSFHSGDWKDFGVTDANGEVKKEILPRTYTFRLSYDNASVSKRQDVSADSLVVFSTVEVSVVFSDSVGNPIGNGSVFYHSGSWKSFGFTDSSGIAVNELLPRKYTFRLTYLDASVSKRQDVGVDSVVAFNTINVTVGFFDSKNNSIENAVVTYHSGGWNDFGITDSNGITKKEILPRTYTFRLTYDGASISKRQDVNLDSFVIFNTIEVTVKLQDSTGALLSDGEIYYHSAGWKYLGITNENGSVHGDILPRKYTFRVTYDGASLSTRQDISTDPVVIFSTIQVTVRLQTSNGSALIGGNVSYHSGGWKHFGFTNSNGEVTKEMMPIKCTFRMGYDGTYISKRQDVSSGSLVVFSTVEVSVVFSDSVGNPIGNGSVFYHSGSWKSFGFTDSSGIAVNELLPRKYTFRLTYLDASVSKRQDVGVDSVVAFNTINVTVRMQSLNGSGLAAGNVSFHSGGWKHFGITGLNGEVSKEILPRTYTFLMKYDGASVSKRQDVGANSTVVFSRIQVAVILQDSIGNPLENGSINYHSAGWKSFGVTDSNGQTINELLPRKFTFRAVYEGIKYTKRQNVGEDSVVIIETDTVENYPPVSDPDGPYSGYINQAIKFNGSKSYDPDGSIVNYTWDFGDGVIGYGASPEHKYNQTDEYIVNLTVKDNEGLTSYNITYVKITEKQTNTVVSNNHHYSGHNEIPSQPNDQEDGGEEIIEDEVIEEDVNSPPVAKAAISESNEEDIVLFDASESCDPDGDQLSYRWDFDNNGEWDTDYSNEPTVSYKYSNNNPTGQARVEVFDGENSDETTISYVVELNVEQSQEIINQESSSKKQYYLIIEWWVIFTFIIISIIVVLYAYKNRCSIIKKIKSSCIIPKSKQQKMGKLVTVIFKLFCM